MSKDMENVEPSQELVEAARNLVKLAGEALGEIPEGCSRPYATASTAVQMILPALAEVDEDDNPIFTLQGIGAGLRAYFRDAPATVSLALVRDLISGMINTEVSHEAAAAESPIADLFSGIFMINPGKEIN